MLLQMSSKWMRRLLIVFSLLCFNLSLVGADIIKKNDNDLMQKYKPDVLQSNKSQSEKNSIDKKIKQYQPQSQLQPQVINSNSAFNFPNKVVKLHIWLGACKYLPDTLKIVNLFKSQHKDIEYHFYIQETDEKFNMETVRQDLKDITFEYTFDYPIPQKTPHFLFTDGNKEYSITGVIDLEDVYKEFVKATTSINKGIQGRHCNVVQTFNQNASEKPELNKINIKEMLSEIKSQLTVKLPHGKLQKIYVNTEGSNYLPFKKFVVVSQKDLELINSDTWGCCTDCGKANSKIQPCPKELLDKLGVKTVPAEVYFVSK